jgi:ATP-binding cassette subfamily B protein
VIKEKKIKLYKQQNAMDCGPTCLKMVLQHFGKKISIQILRDLCHTNREGSSIKSIVIASEELGLNSIGIKCNIGSKNNSDIPNLEDLQLPLIAHWKKHHFVVIYKSANNKFHIADPAVGKLILTKQDVEKHLLANNEYGKVIVFEPTEKLYSNENSYFNNQSIINKIELLKGLVSENKKSFSILFVLLLIQLLIQLTSPFLTQITFDSGILKR